MEGTVGLRYLRVGALVCLVALVALVAAVGRMLEDAAETRKYLEGRLPVLREDALKAGTLLKDVLPTTHRGYKQICGAEFIPEDGSDEYMGVDADILTTTS